MKTLLGFYDLAQMFKVTMELYRSNLSMSDGGISVFSENNICFLKPCSLVTVMVNNFTCPPPPKKSIYKRMN